MMNLPLIEQNVVIINVPQQKEDPRRITVTSAKRTDDVVQAPSCGAGSVGRTLSKPLPYGWYSKRICKKPLKEVHAAAGKMDGSMFAVRGVDAKTVWMCER